MTKIKRVEKTIREAVENLCEKGNMQLIRRDWGVYSDPVDGKYVGGECCPMGAVLVYTDTHEVRGAEEDAAAALDISEYEVKAFVYGFDRPHDKWIETIFCKKYPYYTKPFFELGQKLSREYVGLMYFLP